MTKDDVATDKTPVASVNTPADRATKPSDHVVDSIEGKAATAKLNNDAVHRNQSISANGPAPDDDSEAETDIEPGNEAATRASSRKSIKHEDKDKDTASANGHDKSVTAGGVTPGIAFGRRVLKVPG